jgi:glycolate oxidase iron-sulfur subunit
MQTKIHATLINEPRVQEAEAILRTCVHCGFCTATCPTYQLLGDELDGPRGRIYLIKNMLEDNEISAKSQTHLDQCLTCRACETTCPSGVKYSRLLEIGQEISAELRPASLSAKVRDTLLRKLMPVPAIFRTLTRLGNLFKPFLPASLAEKVPPTAAETFIKHDPVAEPIKRVLVLEGCVQKGATPQVNQALTQLLAKQGVAVSFLQDESCCGSVDYHLSAPEAGRNKMRRLIDQLHPSLNKYDAIVSTASGCGATLKEYEQILQYDISYKSRAADVVERIIDASELLAEFEFSITADASSRRVAYHAPCTLQHGQKLPGAVEAILTKAGFDLVRVDDAHLCCGSAGTYSVTHPKIAGQLLDQKLAHLQKHQPEIIATANVGCQLHIGSRAKVPVVHWVELLAEAIE